MLRYTLIFLVALSAITVSSCKKTTPCEATVTVTDSLGRPLPGASVVLRQDSVVNAQTGERADIFEEEYTTGAGQAFFTFPNEAVLNIEVTYSTKFVKDYIRLEQSTTVYKTVIVK